ncbi:hypothetical protein SAMD00019534_030340 [Acytostelium subglobosum LB1]|uniref:hypothetical protein n=1 Tax=Acytostelium subglobosum LB1 TaxID=1410327 RepID=UPI000644819F|nr:hypothetical protein SAMD00019534_030340 [Acytostelium subglobosum LB1]GAM19859.1 hypothetical protein SAMD00019534_030340 [Acytostelium subglobosum LB1]|eukprot:XP_012756621.1 hypothetical protein SAMD00019534_030340 [Acytostelium subglobosum LB1]
MHAVRYGQIDVYKLLQSRAPLVTHRKDPNYISDHLLLALNRGQLSMFNYLLSFETPQSMIDRIRMGRDFARTFYHFSDPVAMSSILKILIRYIETECNKDASFTPSQAISCLLKDTNPFGILLRCQDIELAQLTIKYVPKFDAFQLYKYCNYIFDHGDGSFNAPYIPLKDEIEQQKLKHTVEFLFALLKLYGRHVDSTEVQFTRCFDVLTEYGVLVTDIYVIMSSQYVPPPLMSYIRRGIITNIRQGCDVQYLDEFIEFFLLQANNIVDQMLIDFNSICTYGTIEIVTMMDVHLQRRHHDLAIHLDKANAYPKTMEILKYIIQRGWYPEDQKEMLIHFISIADPGLLKTILAEYDINGLFTGDDDDDDDYLAFIDSMRTHMEHFRKWTQMWSHIFLLKHPLQALIMRHWSIS